ncbi:hypothetical protein AJ79_03583 [Helicocarpus griseus UAMH5409]|uniref:Uncharacterized protein n=1 Tax=Helicocarpus griseus UAMH5409 TaxID=1447875 RepID=A0A2B7XX44_9EURO|nr:hypothetical protein AJ79_03583 [Helicocarpus griseus UAMH5409]
MSEEWNGIIHEVLKDVPVTLVDDIIRWLSEASSLRVLKCKLRILNEDFENAEANHNSDEGRVSRHYLSKWLESSVELGLESCATLLIEAGADVNHTRYVGSSTWETLLEIALSNHHVGVAEVLVNHGADLETGDSFDNDVGYRLLCYAAHKNKLSLVKTLLDRGVPITAYPDDFDVSDEFPDNPLLAALLENHLEMALLLLDRGATTGYSPSETIEELFSCDTAIIMKNCATNETEFDYLIPGNESLALFLIEHGWKIKPDNIRAAAKGSPLTFLQRLVEKAGKDWAAPIALDAASSVNNFERVEHFLAQGVKPKWLNLDAVTRGYVDMVKLLLEAGANPNTETRLSPIFGNALYRAAAVGSVELVKLLLECGVSVDSRSGFYGSALHVAVVEEHEKVVRVLLKWKADITHQSDEHGTALDVGRSSGSKAIRNMLVEYRELIRVENETADAY